MLLQGCVVHNFSHSNVSITQEPMLGLILCKRGHYCALVKNHNGLEADLMREIFAASFAIDSAPRIAGGSGIPGQHLGTDYTSYDTRNPQTQYGEYILIGTSNRSR